jgi:hypothetical protein
VLPFFLVETSCTYALDRGKGTNSIEIKTFNQEKSFSGAHFLWFFSEISIKNRRKDYTLWKLLNNILYFCAECHGGR